MNKREVQQAIKAAEPVKAAFPLGEIEELLEKYEEARDGLQEKIDRLEYMDELGDTLQQRLDDYNERMTALESAIEHLETMRDTYSEFEEALDDLEATA